MSNNVSYQLFNKQLTELQHLNYACPQDGKYLSTCISEQDSGVLVENAFQSQLRLSEYYKGQTKFEVIKTNFMDRVMENVKY